MKNSQESTRRPRSAESVDQSRTELSEDILEKAAGGTGFNPMRPPLSTKNVCPSCHKDTVVDADVTVIENGVTRHYSRQCTNCLKCFSGD